MLLLFIGTGRLGNQLFQLNGIDVLTRKIKQKKIIILNMPEINECVNISLNLKVINNRIVIKIFDNFLCYIFNILSRIKIIGSIRCVYDYHEKFKLENTYFLKKGLLPFLWIPTYYFQKAVLVKDISFSIKEDHIKKAIDFFVSLPKDHEFVFIHIRKTDYTTFEVLGKKGADLPLSYYYKAVQIFLNMLNKPFFVFLTDDPGYIAKNFSDIPHKAISNLDQFGDLALMSLCEYGVLSNSSFSWWGAFFMKNRKKVIAPRYWLGFKSQVEYPPGIIAPWMDLINVE